MGGVTDTDEAPVTIDAQTFRQMLEDYTAVTTMLHNLQKVLKDVRFFSAHFMALPSIEVEHVSRLFLE